MNAITRKKEVGLLRVADDTNLDPVMINHFTFVEWESFLEGKYRKQKKEQRKKETLFCRMSDLWPIRDKMHFGLEIQGRWEMLDWSKEEYLKKKYWGMLKKNYNAEKAIERVCECQGFLDCSRWEFDNNKNEETRRAGTIHFLVSKDWLSAFLVPRWKQKFTCYVRQLMPKKGQKRGGKKHYGWIFNEKKKPPLIGEKVI